jgi:tryptophan synthase alpha chain
VTGSREADAGQIAPAVARARLAAGLPVAVGFGIRTPERAAEVARVADAVVVGSALVDCVEDAIAQNRDPVSKLLATAARLAQAVRSARLDES